VLANLTLSRVSKTVAEVENDLLIGVVIAELRDQRHEAITVGLHGLLITLPTTCIILLEDLHQLVRIKVSSEELAGSGPVNVRVNDVVDHPS
jgi:hypothetical protein